MRIGGRTLKTGLAITLSLSICHYFDIGPAIFAAITAMINLQPSIYQSYKNAIEQVGVTAIGIIIGLALALSLGNAPIVVGVASVLVITIALKLNWQGVIQIGIVTTIFILDSPTADFFGHSISRISLIGVGLLVALAINILLAPPSYIDMLKAKLQKFHISATTFFKEEIINFVELKEVNPARTAELDKLLAEGVEIKRALTVLNQEIAHGNQELKQKAELLEELYQLDSHLLNKVDLLQDVLPKRLDRRAERGNPPYTPLFREIVELISQANNNLSSNARLLELAIIKEEEVESLISFTQDEELDKILDTWHEEHMGDIYYLHALMEVSMVVYEIRWVHSQQERIFAKLSRTASPD